jgi:hypothetical protein
VIGGLLISGSSLPAGTVGTSYSAILTAAGGALPYHWSASGIPPGLTLNQVTGQITGVPTLAGSFVIPVSVSDFNGLIATAQYTVTITAPLPPPLRVAAPVSLATATVGVQYLAAFGASGGSEDSYRWSASGVPPGLSMSVTGFLSGIPTTVGQYNISVRVTDNAQNVATRDYGLQVQPAPLVITGNPPGGIVGTPLTVTFGATGGIAPYVFSLTGSTPPGMVFRNGTLSGTPTSPGTFSFTITATDNVGTFTTKAFAMTVVPPTLAVPGGSLPEGQVGVAYSGRVGATGGTPPYRFAGSAPAGLTLAADGSVSGTPSADGQFEIRVEVTDAGGIKASGTYNLKIIPETLRIVTTTLPDGVVNAAYSATVAAAGGVPPFVFTIGGTPAGVSGTPDGSIAGTPTAPGAFTISVTVKDASGATANRSFDIRIAPAPLTITVRAGAGTVGTAYSGTATASGGIPPYTYAATGLPAGISIAAATGTISGTPSAAGASNISVTARDSAGTTATATAQVTISLPAAPPVSFTGVSPVATPAGQQSFQVAFGTPYPVDVTALMTLTFVPDSGQDDRTIAFAAGGRTTSTPIPAGASLSPAVGVQTGTVAGVITITVRLMAGSTEITPAPAPITIRTNPAAPVIRTVTATRNANGFSVTTSGFVTNREITQAVFTFNATPGSTLQTTSITVAAGSIFSTWFTDAASSASGSQFTFTQPFSVQGNAQSIASVTVTLVNQVGSSSQVTANLQ